MSPQSVFFDSATPPTVAQLEAARPHALAWAGYLGSPHAYHGWTTAQLKVVLQVLGHLLPVWAAPTTATSAAQGKLEAQQAIAEVRALGGSHPTIALDSETGANDGAEEYAEAFHAEVQAANMYRVQYGNPSFLERMAHVGAPGLMSAGWVAAWPKGQLTVPSLDAWPVQPSSLYSGQGERAWQYRGNVEAYGMLIDISTSAVGFPFMVAAQVPPPVVVPTPPKPPVKPAQTVHVNGTVFALPLTITEGAA